MKSFIIGLFLLVSTSASANLFLPSCYNYSSGGDAVSFSYQACLNNNFRAIERAVEDRQFFQYCSNVGNQVSYFFVSCVQNNFRKTKQALRNRNLFLQRCTNFNPDTLDFSFTSCVNSNWRSVERAVR